MNTNSHLSNARFQLVPSSTAHFESQALDQLAHAADKEGVIKVFGYPDLHPGKGMAIGSTTISTDYIYPFLIGGDIGCGMGFWKTDMKTKKAKLDRLTRKLAAGMETRSNSVIANVPFLESLGTIGGGNHFAEIQSVEKIHDHDLADANGISEQCLYVLIHSGSRGFGESILRKHTSRFADQGLKTDSAEAKEYLDGHDAAYSWAKTNRELIADNVSHSLGIERTLISDVTHNSISRKEIDGREYWIHRKGAAAGDCGPVVIAGTRGSLSYLVQPIASCENHAWSLSHGAGRKWQRGECRARLSKRFRKSDLQQTALGSRVVCDDKDLLYEEAPQAYKNIDTVVRHLTEAGLVRVIASLRPLVTYKCSRANNAKGRKRV